MFCFIGENWRCGPLISVETVVELISKTSASKGLKIVCVEDKNKHCQQVKDSWGSKKGVGVAENPRSGVGARGSSVKKG
jgi:hypothetical protein